MKFEVQEQRHALLRDARHAGRPQGGEKFLADLNAAHMTFQCPRDLHGRVQIGGIEGNEDAAFWVYVHGGVPALIFIGLFIAEVPQSR